MNIRQTFVIWHGRGGSAPLGALSIAVPSRHGRCVFKCPNRAAQGVPEVMYACEVGNLDSATADLPLQTRFHIVVYAQDTAQYETLECFRDIYMPYLRG